MTLIKFSLKIILIACCFSSCQNAKKLDYLFANDFKGWAIVIFNSHKGKDEVKKEGRIQLEIPTNGILFTKSKRPEGILDNQYFILRSNGERVKIYPSIEEVPKNDTLISYVLVESYQSLKFKTINENWLNFDEVIIFKITKGFKDTIANKLEIDTYISSVKQNIIQDTQ